MSAQGIEYSYPGRADVKWMRRLSGKNRTEFSPRVPIDSQIFPFCPLIRVISYLRHCCGTRIFKFGSIRFHCVPFLLFLAFGHASAAVGRHQPGAVRPAQASSTIDRTHDHMLSKTKGLGKRQMLSGFPNAIALGLRGIGLDEAAVAVGQVDDETVGLTLHAADDRQSLADSRTARGPAHGTGARTSPWSGGDPL